MTLRTQILNATAPEGVALKIQIDEAKRAMISLRQLHPDIEECTITIRNAYKSDIQQLQEGVFYVKRIFADIEVFHCNIEVAHGFNIIISEQ